MRTSRSSQIGGAVVGGIVGTVVSVAMPITAPFGCLGILLGGLSGKRVSDDTVNRLDIVLILNDTTAPRFAVNLLSTKTKKSKAAYRHAIQRARHWNSVCDVIISQGNAPKLSHPPILPVFKASPPPLPPSRYFLYLNEEVKGPYRLSEIKVLSEVGTVTAETPICAEGSQNWSAFGSLS